MWYQERAVSCHYSLLVQERVKSNLCLLITFNSVNIVVKCVLIAIPVRRAIETKEYFILSEILQVSIHMYRKNLSVSQCDPIRCDGDLCTHL